jgi:hypothetical protein
MSNLVDANTCLSIQCGATTQLEAGMNAIMSCAEMGQSGVRSCQDPQCEGNFRPIYCNPPAAAGGQPIPYSPPNDGTPYTQTTEPPAPTFDSSVYMPNETKRRREYYQDMVLCPGGEVTPFWIGLEHWQNFGAIEDNIPVMPDMDTMELLGFLTPAAILGWLGYLYLNGKLFEK